MNGYVEFTGKTLDEAILDACTYFDVEREKLEIEIINDAKSGIFGLVGAKKATLRARRVQLRNIGLNFQDSATANAANTVNAGESSPTPPFRIGSKASPPPAPEALTGAKLEALTGTVQKALPESALKELPAARSEAQPATLPESNAKADRHKSGHQGKAGKRGNQASQSGRQAPREKNEACKDRNEGQKTRQPFQHNRAKNSPIKTVQADGNKSGENQLPEENALPFDAQLQDFKTELPEVPLESIDQTLLKTTILDALEHLVQPITGPTENSFKISDGRVRLQIECSDNQGLLIGRDGQTLAALQYLLSCIASRRLNASIHVQIDAGEYREKQNEKLHDLALHLAQKVKASSHPQSTRPMSAYQRRIIHMTLQDDPDVQTHSKGEGGLKRVVIVPRRKTPDQTVAQAPTQAV
jgi:spoIIIJ-associated protein